MEKVVSQADAFIGFTNETRAAFTEALTVIRASTHVIQDAQSQLFDETGGNPALVTVERVVSKIESLKGKPSAN